MFNGEQILIFAAMLNNIARITAALQRHREPATALDLKIGGVYLETAGDYLGWAFMACLPVKAHGCTNWFCRALRASKFPTKTSHLEVPDNVLYLR